MSKMEIDEEASRPSLSLYIFLTIRTAQLQHGLRHGDYERYRHVTHNVLPLKTERQELLHVSFGTYSKKALDHQ